MAEVTFRRDRTGLLVVDPYNDFISEGGKLWPRVREVVDANRCIRTCSRFSRRRVPGVRVFFSPHHRWRPGDYQGRHRQLQLG
jgi:hypothetical protein